MLQTLNLLIGPSLDSLQYLYVSPVLISLELIPALRMYPHQHRAERLDLPSGPVGNSFPHTAQDAFGLLCFQGASLAHSQLLAALNT